MTIVAHSHPFVIGVDTHARTHTYTVVVAATGQRLRTQTFPNTPAGRSRATAWAGRCSGGDTSTLWVIECIGTYGARLAHEVAETGYQVVEAPKMSAKDRRGAGKSDSIDSAAIAAAVLPLEESALRLPRQDDGSRAALRVLITARDQMTEEHTANVNALTALLRAHDLGFDARKPLTAPKIREISRWRHRAEPIAAATARTEAVRLASRVTELGAAIKANHARMTEIIQASPAAPLLDITGVGAVTAAIVIAAWSHPGRLRNEAAFASLAGVNPIPASSGNTTRRRLNRGGDRRLNQALHTATITRMTHDPETRSYVARRITEGRTKSEIRRCLA